MLLYKAPCDIDAPPNTLPSPYFPWRSPSRFRVAFPHLKHTAPHELETKQTGVRGANSPSRLASDSANGKTCEDKDASSRTKRPIKANRVGQRGFNGDI